MLEFTELLSTYSGMLWGTDYSLFMLGIISAPLFPRAWSRYVLSKMPPKRAAVSKKNELVWTDNEAELLLPQAEQSGCIPFLFSRHTMAN